MSFHLKTLPKHLVDARCVLPANQGHWPYVGLCSQKSVGVLMEQDFEFVEAEFGVNTGKHLAMTVCQEHANQISSMIDPG